MQLVPVKFNVNDYAKVEIKLYGDTSILRFEAKVQIFKIIKKESHYEVVFIFDIDHKLKNDLEDYVTYIQRELIKDFKGVEVETLK